MLHNPFKARPRGSAAAEALCHTLEAQLEREAQKRITEAGKTIARLTPDWERQVDEHMNFVTTTSRARAGMRRGLGIGDTNTTTPGRLSLQATGPFLQACHRHLHHGAEGNERMMLISGPIAPDGTRVLSSIEPVAYASQSPGYVQLDPADTHRQVIKICESQGCELHAAFHSHVMRGPASTAPSTVDLTAMARWVAQGWRAIGGIFSTDGFVRLFSTSQEFDFHIYGNGAEVIEQRPREKILKLTPTE